MHLALKLAKSANKGKTKFSENIEYGYQKTQNVMLISNPLKKFHKKSHKRSYKQNKLKNMSKSEKSAYFHHVFLLTFFVWNFC
jgi:hypothetical protein